MIFTWFSQHLHLSLDPNIDSRRLPRVEVTHLSLSPALNWIILGFADGSLDQLVSILVGGLEHAFFIFFPKMGGVPW